MHPVSFISRLIEAQIEGFLENPQCPLWVESGHWEVFAVLFKKCLHRVCFGKEAGMPISSCPCLPLTNWSMKDDFSWQRRQGSNEGAVLNNGAVSNNGALSNRDSRYSSSTHRPDALTSPMFAGIILDS